MIIGQGAMFHGYGFAQIFAKNIKLNQMDRAVVTYKLLREFRGTIVATDAFCRYLP
jgi:hypothetical protein